MTYSQGGTIEATDYNNRATNVNAIWGTGAGSNGYGQSTTLASVSAAGTVAATNWASMIARIDSIRNHQAGAASGISQPAAGGTVTFLSTLDANITACINNKLAAATTGTTTAVGNVANTTAWTGSAVKEFTITFANTDAVRYFFNAGGKIETYARVASNTTVKGGDWNTFLTNTVGTVTIGSNATSRSGSGGDNVALASTSGYHNLTTVSTTYANIGSTSATADYGLSYAVVAANVGGALYGASSNVVYVRWTLVDLAADTFNDTVAGNTQVFANIVPPETTYLANTWGAVTFGTTVNTQS